MPAPDLDAVRAAVEKMTPGPWSWGHIGEKTNGYVVGIACKEDGTPLAGLVEEVDDRVDTILYRGFVGEHEAATVNYADPEGIVALRNAAPALLDALAAARALVDAVKSEQDWGTNCDPDNFNCVCEGSSTSDAIPVEDRPCSTCRSRAVKRKAVAFNAALAKIGGQS